MPANSDFHPCVISRHVRGKLAAAILLLLAAGHTAAQPEAPRMSAEVIGRHPAGSIHSIEQADAALADVSRARKDIEARYNADEQACQPKFFVTSCVDGVKEWRRHELQKLRPVEIEANAFKRQERAARRDAGLAEKQLKDEAGPNGSAAQPHTERQRKQPQPKQPQPQPGADHDRVAEHEAREKQRQAEEQAGAAERAANVAAFERKAEASRKRQEEVAKRKAEKEERRRAKQAGGDTSPAGQNKP